MSTEYYNEDHQINAGEENQENIIATNMFAVLMQQLLLLGRLTYSLFGVMQALKYLYVRCCVHSIKVKLPLCLIS
jgi:hypothetical protein